MLSPPLLVVPDDCPWTIVLGVDPGTQVVGYGALVLRDEGPRLLAAGVIRAGRGRSVPARLATVRNELDALLARLKPAVVVVEKAFAALNIASALRVGEGRGVALSCAASFGAEVHEYTPAEAKKSVVGNGQADKTQVAAMVMQVLALAQAPEPLDATDALALALTYVHKSRLIGRL
jgi:crossover junction endodeoxyribonuclease RuvC